MKSLILFLKFTFLLLILIYLLPGCIFKNSNSETSWKLVFEDNFSRNYLDTAKWSVIDRNRPGWNNDGFKSGEFLQIKNGYLILTAYTKKDKNGKDSIISGGVQTKNKVSIKYGKVEVRAKLFDTDSMNSAIWMLSEKPKYGKGDSQFRKYAHYNGEIDILERFNSEDIARNNIHTFNTANKIDKSPANEIKLKVKDFHVYSAEILPSEIRFYMDKKLTLRYKKKDDGGFGQFPFDQNFYLMIEMLTSRKYGFVNKENKPTKMVIDWVKIYELIENK